ncbi:hypothetical protein JKF63_04720 [Porcisia hertigi]|uniref:mRNA 5'-phosphatase n=1 Tax=Porcisia hertigi TaxID=2761500 RepID=A0A836HNA8_9TRYP|nr:hypothetical protein JKF63_04720 [Porcisia hertigi]
MEEPCTPLSHEGADGSSSASPSVLAPLKAAVAPTAEAAGTSGDYEEVCPHSQCPLSVATSLLARIKPFLSRSHIEVEARLCKIGHPRKVMRDDDTSRVTASRIVALDSSCNAMRILEAFHQHVQVGVSAEDFARMKTYVAKEKVVALPLQEAVTEDVNTQTGRYTYAIAVDGSKSFVGRIMKKRLCNVEVHVPKSPYDIRVSVSTEVVCPGADAPAVKSRGHVRHKRRWTATENTYEYAFTRVGADDDPSPIFEVEIEGVHVNSQADVTEAWLADLLNRLLVLAQLKGNTGLQQNPGAVEPKGRHLR